jgi:AraC-like DNA-binding protein
MPMDADGRYARQVRALTTLVFDGVGGGATTRDIGDQSFYSRSHLHRMFRQQLGESPGAMMRRLALERAAFQLIETTRSVIDIGLDAGYGSGEAFAHAFTRAFNASPMHYRRRGTNHYRLPAASGIHFLPARAKQFGGSEMDIVTHLLAHDAWLTRQLIERARTILDADLDRAVLPEDPWGVTEPTLRQTLSRLVFTREMYLSMFTGEPYVEDADMTPDGMLRRLDAVDGRFAAVVDRVVAEGAWDERLQEADGTPADRFTFGSAIEHIITYQAHRRMTALEAMWRLGIEDLGFGDPGRWVEPDATAAR